MHASQRFPGLRFACGGFSLTLGFMIGLALACLPLPVRAQDGPALENQPKPDYPAEPQTQPEPQSQSEPTGPRKDDPESFEPATFQRLGKLRGGEPFSTATAVSDDGRSVAGVSGSNIGREACLWRLDQGIIGLGDLAGGPVKSICFDMNADGSVLVGIGTLNHNAFGPFIWSQRKGMRQLTLSEPSEQTELFGHTAGKALGITDNGRLIVGYSQSKRGRQATAWVIDLLGTEVIGLGDLPGGGVDSYASAVSSQGGVIAGQGFSTNGPEAFRWNRREGMVGLGDLPGGPFQSMAIGVSPDGGTIVGQGVSEHGPEAFRWTARDGMQPLGVLPGGKQYFSVARAVSRDGRLIVGQSIDQVGSKAFVWSEASGMQPLMKVLAERGQAEALKGWVLIDATDISANGRYIVGSAINPKQQLEAFWVDLGSEPF